MPKNVFKINYECYFRSPTRKSILATHLPVPALTDGQVLVALLVRLVRLQTDNFRLFLHQQTDERLTYVWANSKRITENRLYFRFRFNDSINGNCGFCCSVFLACAYVYVFVYTYIYTYIHTPPHTYTHTHTHTHWSYFRIICVKLKTLLINLKSLEHLKFFKTISSFLFGPDLSNTLENYLKHLVRLSPLSGKRGYRYFSHLRVL